MFVSNYYKLIHALFSVARYSVTAISVKRVTGSNMAVYAEATRNYTANEKYWLLPRIANDTEYSKITTTFRNGVSYSSAGLLELALGTGNEEPTIDDYTLSGDLVTTFSILSSETRAELIENESVYTFEAVIKNTGSTAITVGEIALLTNVRATSTGGCYSVMIERTALDETIIIEPSNTATITYQVKTVLPVIPTA